MLTVEDVLTELDVLALDSTVLDAFGATPDAVSQNLRDKRTVAVMSWVARRLEGASLSPVRHSLRRAPTKVYGVTSGVATDYTDAASDKTVDDVPISSILRAASDAIYIGYSEPVLGLYVGMQDNVNTNTLTTASVAFWNGGRWTAFNSVVNPTFASASIALSGGGAIRWQEPVEWQKRPLQSETTWRYWIRLSLNQAPTAGTAAAALLPIRRSRLTDPAARHALSLLYAESWGAQNGNWERKAELFAKDAATAMDLVLPALGDEFTAADEESVTPEAQNTVAEETDVDPFAWFRG